jgi:hypothetical protein
VIREAILLGNTAKTDDPRTSVTRQQAQKHITDIAGTLAQLGEHSFHSTAIIDQPADDAISQLRNAVRKAANRLSADQDEGSCLLFYYFGHGVQRDRDLYFKCRDSVTSQLPTMIGFTQTAELVFGFGISRAIFVVDCCYAGAAVYRIHSTIGPGHSFGILASTIPAQRAEVQPGDVPFGAFSLFLFGGLRDSEGTDSPSQNVTVSSLHRYVTERLEAQGFDQEPYKIDGGLNDFVLSEAESAVVVSPRYNAKAPRKSLYSKLWWIANAVHDLAPVSRKVLYGRVKKDRPVEFLTPFKTTDGTIYEPVTEQTFLNYVSGLLTLGVISQDDPMKLTQVGRALVATGGARFNMLIIDLIDKEFKRWNLSNRNLEMIVRLKAKTRGIPTAAELYLDARRLYKITMKPEWFAALLDLLGHAGYLRYSGKKTFFAY